MVTGEDYVRHNSPGIGGTAEGLLNAIWLSDKLDTTAKKKPNEPIA